VILSQAQLEVELEVITLAFERLWTWVGLEGDWRAEAIAEAKRIAEEPF